MVPDKSSTLSFGYISSVSKKFNSSSTALQVLEGYNLKGKTALITGANSGIGFETARALVIHDCSVIFACRNITAANEAITKIMEEKSNAHELCEVIRLDLASITSIAAFASIVKNKYSQLDYLILNAGVLDDQKDMTENGFETTFQVNHLSHFHLTNLLLNLLKVGSRVIIVASEVHRKADLSIEHLEDVSVRNSKSGVLKYKNSKLCNVLHAHQLAKQLQNSGVNVFSLHPGTMVSTSLHRNRWLYSLMSGAMKPIVKNIEQAAATVVYCACNSELAHLTGVYFKDCYPCRESIKAQNEEFALALWNFSTEKLAVYQ